MKTPAFRFVFGFGCSLLLVAPLRAEVETPSAFDWKLSSPVGAKYLMRYRMSNKVAQKVPRGDGKTSLIETTTHTAFTANYDVISRDFAGNPTIRITYGPFTARTQSKTDGVPMRPSVARTVQEDLNEMLGAFRGSTFLLKTTPRGDTIAVQGLTALRFRLLRALQNYPGASGAGNGVIHQMLDDDNIKETFGRLSGQIPNYPIRVGETWEYKNALPAAFPVAPTLMGRRTLVSLSPTLATLRDSAILSVKARDWQPSRAPQKFSFQMFGTQDATTLLSTQTGLPIRVSLYQRMNGSLSGTLPGQKQPFNAPMWGATEMSVAVSPRKG